MQSNQLYIVWSKENEIGIPIIDEQHRGVISSINSLYYYMNNGQSAKVVNPIMKMLEQYVYIHFDTEETIMAKLNYPEIEEHKKQHQKLVRKAKILFVDAQKKNNANEILRFLKDWWLNHIQYEDKKITSFAKNNP